MDQSYSEQPTIQQKPQKSFLFLKILSVCILILATTSGGYVLGVTQSKSVKSNILSPQKTAAPTILVPTGTIEDKNSSSWKTYTNPFYHFSLRYPPALSVTEVSESSIEFSDVNHGFPVMIISVFDLTQAQPYIEDLGKILTTKKVNNFNYSQIALSTVEGGNLYSFNKAFDYSARSLPPTGGPTESFGAQGIIDTHFYDIFYNYTPEKFDIEQKTFQQIIASIHFTK